MLKLATGLLLLAGFAQLPPGISTETNGATPDPDEILKHVEDALGWTDRFNNTRTLEIRGTLDGAPITVSAKQPSLFRMELDAGKQHITQAYDGSFGWQKNSGEHAQAPAPLTGPQLDQLIDQASNAIGGPLVNAAARGTEVVYEGREKVDGKDCHKLALTLVSGTVIHVDIDAASYLETREEIVGDGGKRGVIEETVGDYQRFDGILFPCRFVSGLKGEKQRYELRLTKVTLNPTLSDTFFTMPKN